jgi:ABC-type multidrug transport system ATPase subunit
MRDSYSRSNSNSPSDFDNRRNISVAFDEITVRGSDSLIIDGVRGSVGPGELVALMGPTGCGKTTTLMALSGRREFEGSFVVNGKEMHPNELGQRLCLVEQHDTLLDCQTPREILTFAAKMRLRGCGDEVDQLVNEILEELGLESCADLRVRNGLSGGQIKRVCIGRELICSPQLIIMDEPTSSLDSLTAYNIMLLMKKLAEKGRSIIFSIHQPSNEICELFSRIIFINEGKVVISGNLAEVQQAATNRGEHIDPKYQLVNQLFAICDRVDDSVMEEWAQEELQKPIPGADSMPNEDLPPFNFTPAPFCSQLFHLSIREFQIQTRNFEILIEYAILLIFFTVFLICFFGRALVDDQNVAETTVISAVVIYAGYNSVPIAQNVTNRTKDLFRLEYRNRTYSVFAYFISIMNIIALKVAISCSIITLFVHYGTSLQGSVTANLATLYFCMLTLCVTVVFFIHLLQTEKAANVMFIFLVSLEGMLTFCKPNQILSEETIYAFSYFFWSRFTYVLMVIENSSDAVIDQFVADAKNPAYVFWLIAAGHFIMFSAASILILHFFNK